MLVKWLCIEELVSRASCLKSWTGMWVWGVTSSSLFCVTNQLSRNIKSEGKGWGKGRVQGGTVFILEVWWEHCDEERWDENRTILFSRINWWWCGWWWHIYGKAGVRTVIVFTARSTDVEKMTDTLVWDGNSHSSHCRLNWRWENNGQMGTVIVLTASSREWRTDWCKMWIVIVLTVGKLNWH